MYYHVMIETKKPKHHYMIYDEANVQVVEDEYVKPYLLKRPFRVQGDMIEPDNIEVLAIKRSVLSADNVLDAEQVRYKRNGGMSLRKESAIFSKNTIKDVTNEILNNVAETIRAHHEVYHPRIPYDLTRVFILSDGDEGLKAEIGRFVKMLGLKAVMLDELPLSGSSLPRELAKLPYCGFALVLYTADHSLENEARQMTLFEHGYCLAKLGEGRVCTLRKGAVILPDALDSLYSLELDAAGRWKNDLIKRLKEADYVVEALV